MCILQGPMEELECTEVFPDNADTGNPSPLSNEPDN